MLRGFGIVLVCLAALAPTRTEADARVVVVQSGEVLGTIARREGVDVSQLKAWNSLDSDMIRIGQKLVIRKSSTNAKTSRTAKTANSSKDDGIDWTPPFDVGEPARAPKPKSAPLATRDASTAVAVGPTGRKPSQTKGRTYTVKTGDTLNGIALRHDTTLDELMKANPGLHPNRIYPGQTIDVGQPRPQVVFRLERGDTLAAVSKRYGVSQRDIARWNPKVGMHTPRAGTAIRIHTRAGVSESQAIGPTNRGRLENPERLPAHRAYVIRTPARAYGTEETIRWIVDAFDEVDRKFRHTKVVRVHDISDRDGGSLRDHKSHQNGRDADISYYQKHCPVSGCRFAEFRSSELDVARQWTLLEHWLRNGQAEMIFIDYRLQGKLYKYARKKGVSKAKLADWIQYPRGRYEPRGVIRHFPNHEDHLHVRFVCPYSDLRCRR
jgi:LysM repeat protein